MSSRLSRRLQVAVQALIAAVILGAVLAVGFIEYSGQPSFCLNCHIMRPYYDSWASSSHNRVPCIQCHLAPGVKAEAMGKLQAANQVVKYLTGTYGLKPWAEIEDAACLRSGCHSERKLEGVTTFKGIRFDHAAHLRELRRGKQLRCTSCHHQIVQGEHFTVPEETCFLCHFKDRPPGEPVAGCTGCHGEPPRLVAPAGYVVDHPRYARELLSCLSCHDRVTEGSGDADRARCFTCHNEPERLAQFENTTLVHRVHIAGRNVECAQCHSPLQHRIVSLTPTFELDCRGCHQGAHEAQRLLYAGTGAHEGEPMPSAMFLARVACRGCHGLPENVSAHERVRRAGQATCLECHGVRYANVLPSWQAEMEHRLREVSAVVDAARSRLGAVPLRRRPAADSLLSRARTNVEFVRAGRAVHNIAYADRLLREALALVGDAVRTAGLPYRVPTVSMGPPVAENVCLRCHLGVEREEVAFRGTEFRHEAHVVLGGLDCERCHTPLEEHGGTTLTSRDQCAECHHPRIGALNCASCHPGPGGAPEDVFAGPVGDFRHEPHRRAGLACAECHRPPSMDAKGLACARCHESHHEPEAWCLGCHRGGALAEHSREDHRACAACHEAPANRIRRWTRSVCLVCHADRVEHYASRPCEGCHRVPEIGPPSRGGSSGAARVPGDRAPSPLAARDPARR